MVLHNPGSTNYHTAVMGEKVNYNQNKLRITVYNDYDNSSSKVISKYTIS